MSSPIDPNLAGSIQGPAPIDSSIVAPSSQEQAQQDSIQAADDIAALTYSFSAAMPLLPKPDYEFSVDLKSAVALGLTSEIYNEITTSMDELHSKIMSDLLDGWSKAEAEQAKRVHEWINSPQYTQMLDVRFPNQDSQRFVQTQLNLGKTHAGALQASSEYAQTELDPSNVTFMAGSLILGAGMLVDFSASPLEGSTNVIAEAMPSFQNLVQDPNMAAQLGFIGGMLAAGAASSSAVRTLIGAAEANEKPVPQQAYRDFAASILGLVSNPNFVGHILLRVVDRMPNAEKMPESEKRQNAAIVKTILLATALAALYKGETQWLGEEVKQLLQGDLEGFFKGGTPKDQELRLQVGSQLQAAFAELSPDQRALLLSALAKYFRSNPSLKQLSNIGSVFDNVTAKISRKEIEV